MRRTPTQVVPARTATVLQRADRTQHAIDRVLLHADSRKAVTWLEETFEEAQMSLPTNPNHWDLLGAVAAARDSPLCADGEYAGVHTPRQMASLEAVPGYCSLSNPLGDTFRAVPTRWPTPLTESHDLDRLAREYGPDLGQLCDNGALRDPT